MFYKDQMEEMKRMQDENPDGHIYYPPKQKKKQDSFQDWDLKHAPDHRKSVSTFEQLKTSQLDFFYGEEETSARVWKIDHRLSIAYKYLLRSVMLALSIALFLHVRRRYQMRYYASQVVKRIEKEGGKVVVDDEKLTIMMDGKVQDVISVNESPCINSL